MSSERAIDTSIAARMREDWNARAREDAYYYVAFGRREQDDAEFLGTAADVVRLLKSDLRRLPKGDARARRALDIGCGPGRLMRPMSAFFGEIHGVDISDEMVALARRKLADIPHAHAHHAPHSDLRAFASESFDFVYSYAVFQHIPSREVVLGYLAEAHRVLKPEGVLRCQINGLPRTAKQFDTWSGVRFSAAEVAEFLDRLGFQVLALEGRETQYMWVCAVKGAAAGPGAGIARVRRVTAAHSSEPAIPTRGGFAALNLLVESLPAAVSLVGLGLEVGGRPAQATFIGPAEYDGLRQVTLLLPEGLPTGLHPVRLTWRGEEVCEGAFARVIPAPPMVPRLISATDGVDLLSGTKVVTGTVKVTLEEVLDPSQFSATLGGVPVEVEDIFCTDPQLPRYEVNFRVPDSLGAGGHELAVRLGRRALAPVMLEVALMREASPGPRG
ncbi:MAG: methyltransferase domain-containing protein [Bryobacteraceae bacterium]|nr:methyltransferase domain-containing protein [Bryobacteraceae bacterium]